MPTTTSRRADYLAVATELLDLLIAEGRVAATDRADMMDLIHQVADSGKDLDNVIDAAWKQIAGLREAQQERAAAHAKWQAEPKRPIVPQPRVGDAATDKQTALIARLLDEKVLPAAWDRDGMQARLANGISRKQASQAITTLLSCPNKGQAEAKDAAPGYYTRDDEFYVIVENRAKTHTYAKRLVVDTSGERTVARWEYAPGVGHRLADMQPLTLEQAKEFGHLHGICIICTKQLTDPKSVEMGIGPVCRKRIG